MSGGKRIENMTAEEVEAQRARQRIENMTPRQRIFRRMSRNRWYRRQSRIRQAEALGMPKPEPMDVRMTFDRELRGRSG